MRIMKIFKNFFVDVMYGNKFTSAVRIVLGGMLLFAGGIKIYDPESFGGLIARYDILPRILAGYAAVLIPVLEMVIGLLLVVGYKVRASSLMAVFLMALFIVSIGLNLMRGRSFDCGCFDVRRIGLDINETISAWLVVRDSVFLVAFALLFSAERHLFSLENYCEKMRLKNPEQSKYR
ncbi:MAG: hypothetical protein A2W19_05845 [Spirochaetes bacterium RBG_16_49_21]|nr:MAG: hypothetical protein A2W19_05845 [Spirochaetes bacterium RBG_16_49_21]